MFFSGLLNFGQRLQDQGKAELAAEVYGAIAQSDPAAAGALRETAQFRLDAIFGKGSTGLRAEILLRDFAHSATDVHVIAPMVLGSSIYQLARTATLGRLAASTHAAWFTRGLGARFTAGLTGFGFEVPAFSLSSRGLMQLSGQAVPWDAGSVGRDLAATGLTLGALKLFGYAGHQGIRKIHGVSEFGVSTRLTGLQRFSQAAIPQASMFAGMLAAHRLEQTVGLRPQVDGATTVTDTLASLVSLGVGAHLSHRLMGQPFAKMSREVEARVQRSPEQRASNSGKLWADLSLRSLAVVQGAGSRGNFSVPADTVSPRPMMMEANGNGNGSKPEAPGTRIPMRIFAIPRGESGDQRRFQPHLLFPNLTEAAFEIQVDAARNIEVGSAGKGRLVSPSGKLLEEIKVEKVAGFKSRIQLNFSDGPPLLLELSIEEPRHGDASGYRVALAANQTSYAGETQRFFKPVEQAPRAVQLKYLDFVSDRGVKGERGGIKKYQLFLSNGDVVELEVFVDHKRNGKFKAHSATLSRFSPTGEKSESPLQVVGEAQGIGKIEINGMGYDLELPVKPPSGSRGATLEFPSGLIIKRAPAFEETPPTPEVDLRKPITLIPDPDSARQLNHPRWDEGKISLNFYGEIGGLAVNPHTPLAIDGSFKDGKFVPDLALGETKKFLFHLKDALKPVAATLTNFDGNFILEMPWEEGRTARIAMVQWGPQIGFARDPYDFQKGILAQYRATEIGGEPVTIPADWQAASAEVLAELLPIFRRSSISRESGESITQAAGTPDLVRTQHVEGMPLYWRRAASPTGGVQYELLKERGDKARISALRSQAAAPATFEGIWWARGEERFLLSPWQGSLLEDRESPGVFKDPILGAGEIRLDAEAGRLRLHVPPMAERETMAGLLQGVERNGKTSLVFQLDNGHVLRITPPKNVHPTEAVLSMSIKPADWSEEKFKQDWRSYVEEWDTRGNKIAEGEILPGEQEWILQMGEKRRAIYLDPFHADESLVALRLQTPQPMFRDEVAPPEFIEGVTKVPERISLPEKRPTPVPIPAQTAKPAAAPEPLKVPPVLAPAPTPPRGMPRLEVRVGVKPSELRFPWDEGAFVSPAGETRELMRRAALPDGTLKEGDRAEFVFYGDPYSPNMTESRARVILDKMKNFGENSFYFYGWVMRVPMTFQAGDWIPDTAKSLQVERRIPRKTPEGRLLGNYLFAGFDSNFPVILSSVGTGWGIQVGRDRYIRPFRVVLEKSGQKLLSPDFALSMGEVRPEAQTQLTALENFTFIKNLKSDQLKSYQSSAPPPFQVDAVFGGGFGGRVTPEFGDPLYRTHLTFNGQENILEFSPGYTEHFPEARFTQLRVYDGNGFNWRLLFQHLGEEVKVVGFEANRRRQRLEGLDVTQLDTGLFKVSGVLPPRFRMAGIDARRGFPFQITWYQEERDFALIQVGLGADKFSVDGLAFNPDSWKKEDIFRARDGQELQIRILKIEGRNGAGGRPPVDGPKGEGGVDVQLPNDLDELTQDKGESIMTRGEILKITYELEGPEKKKRKLTIPMRFNPRQRAYEPNYSMGVILAHLDGEPIPVNCHPTLTGRNWRLTFPADRHPMGVSTGRKKKPQPNAFIGNFYVHQSDLGGRPAPLLWFTMSPDPHRQWVNRNLEKWEMAPGIETQIPWTARTLNRPFTATVTARNTQYRIPFHIITLPNNKFMAFPTGPVERQEGEGWKKVVVNYFKAMRGAPAVIEWEGIAYEMEMSLRNGYPRLALRRTHPGASGIYAEDRSRASVMLEPSDQSALLLIDLNVENFLEEVQVVAASKDTGEKRVRRYLWDGISRDTYEFVFNVNKNLVGTSRMELAGIARLTPNGPQIVSQETMEVGGRIYIRTRDGHYLSLSSYPSHSLTVSSHGKVLETLLLKRSWTPMNPPPEIFTQRPVSIAPQDIRELFFSEEDNRKLARDEMADRFGIEQALFWDWNRPFPRGMGLRKVDWDAAQPNLYSYHRGALKIDFEKPAGILEIQNPLVSYHGAKLPFQISDYQGRQHIALGGPMTGVLFYLGYPAPNIYSMIELTHPALREQLESDAGRQYLKRAKFTKDKDGEIAKYPEVTGPLAEAIAKQVGRSRLWRLGEKGLLPQDIQLQDLLSAVLIPDPKNYGPRKRPADLLTLEAMAEENPFQADLKRLLLGLAEGRIEAKDLNPLTAAWKDYRAVPEGEKRKRESALNKVVRIVHDLVD